MNKLYAKAQELLEEIEPQVEFVEIVGSIRRMVDEPNDIDFVIIPKAGETIQDIKLEGIEKTNWSGVYKIQYEIDGIKIDLLSTTNESLGAAIMHFTGSPNFNIGIRFKAKKRLMKLNEYGLFDAQGKRIAGATEQEIFNLLNKEYISPEER